MFAVRKYICSAQIYFPVHKYISQYTNILPSAQIHFSEGNLETNAAMIEALSLIAAIFGRPETQLEGKTLQQPAGSLLVLQTFSQMTLQLKPSIHPFIGNP